MPVPTFVWVALGSALGGVGRYWCVGVIDVRIGERFPWGTLAVNVIGCLIIGVAATLMAPEGRFLIGSAPRQFLMIGILGGFTTFSSFSLQALNLMLEGEWFSASGYVLGSVVLCLLGVWLGHGLGVALSR